MVAKDALRDEFGTEAEPLMIGCDREVQSDECACDGAFRAQQHDASQAISKHEARPVNGRRSGSADWLKRFGVFPHRLEPPRVCRQIRGRADLL
jgi:hypothetical protein